MQCNNKILSFLLFCLLILFTFLFLSKYVLYFHLISFSFLKFLNITLNCSSLYICFYDWTLWTQIYYNDRESSSLPFLYVYPHRWDAYIVDTCEYNKVDCRLFSASSCFLFCFSSFLHFCAGCCWLCKVLEIFKVHNA